MKLPDKLKEKLQKGETVYGPFCKLQDAGAIEIAALAGFDFVIIDMEHGPYSTETAQNMIRAAEVRGITPVVRVTANNESLILRALDIGARGIQVPQVSSRTEAEKAVASSRFFPLGNRGVCRYVRAAGYSSFDRKEYFSSANEHITVIVHIEGIEGLENLNEILETPGIDIIFLGPYDLSQSCGVTGNTNHPVVMAKMEEAVALARKHNKMVGTFVETPDDATKWKNAGVQYISYSVDVGILYNAYSEIYQRLNCGTT